MSSFVPKKPLTPPPCNRPARRHVVMTPAAAALPQQEQGRKRSKSSPSVLESTSPTPPIPADFREHGVCFQERPEIILFLSDPNEGRAVSLPPIRPLAPIAEEVENDLPVGLNGSISMLSTIPYVGGTPLPAGRPRPMPNPQDSSEGGLSALSAGRRATMLQNLFHANPQW